MNREICRLQCSIRFNHHLTSVAFSFIRRSTYLLRRSSLSRGYNEVFALQ